MPSSAMSSPKIPPKKVVYKPAHWSRGRYIEAEEIVIDFTSPPSSPELSDTDSDSDLESIEEIEELSLDHPEASSSTGGSVSATDVPVSSTSQTLQSQGEEEKERSPLVKATDELRASLKERRLLSRSEKANHERCREGVVNYLSHNTVTLEDVKVLVPEFNNDRGLVNKLANNIAYNLAGGRISEARMTTIREYLFTSAGDKFFNVRDWEEWKKEFSSSGSYRLFNLVDKKYGEYRKAMEDNEMSKAIMRRRESKAKAAEAKKPKQPSSKQSREEIKKFPAHMQVRPEMPDILPSGANTVAELYVDIYGFTWEETRDLWIKSNDSSVPKAYHLLPREREAKDFAGTKAPYNFPGRWTERKHDKIVLPPKDAYKGRHVRNTVNSWTRQSKEPGRTFASTKTMYDTIYANHIDCGKGRKIMVRLPPTKPLELIPSENASLEPADLIMPPKNLTFRTELARLTFTTEDTLHGNY